MLASAGFLYGWEFKTGKNLWKPIEIFNSNITSPMSIDINNDGTKDIIVLSESPMLLIYDGLIGEIEITRKEILEGAISGMTPLVADLTGNDKMDGYSRMLGSRQD
ncbi:MAG: VCBS repeat-containing protein [Endomicrobium sp.]|jgi:hypothetical protein|nr:VCBS repeat-containing protein [Endomicrobium sp.]